MNDFLVWRVTINVKISSMSQSIKAETTDKLVVIASVIKKRKFVFDYNNCIDNCSNKDVSGSF